MYIRVRDPSRFLKGTHINLNNLKTSSRPAASMRRTPNGAAGVRKAFRGAFTEAFHKAFRGGRSAGLFHRRSSKRPAWRSVGVVPLLCCRLFVVRVDVWRCIGNSPSV